MTRSVIRNIRQFLLGLSICLLQVSHAQISTGSTAPDFTITDLNGTTHNLYTYLSAGKIVYLDFFACHCPSCWAYHNTHALRDLNNKYGPSGTLSQDLVVIAIEHDSNNGSNEFNGISGNTQGNWVSGTTYPLCNPEGTLRAQIITNYAVNYYPMIYAICPDKKVTLIGTQTESNLYNHKFVCAGTVGLQNWAADNELTIFPNPASSQVNIQSGNTSSRIKSVTAIDALGRKVLDLNANEPTLSVDISKLEIGFYYFNILTSDGVFRKVVIKNN